MEIGRLTEKKFLLDVANTTDTQTRIHVCGQRQTDCICRAAVAGDGVL